MEEGTGQVGGSHNKSFTGSGAWRRLHCNPAARHAPCGARVRAELSGLGKAGTLATVLKTELFEGDGWIPGLAVADHGVEHNEELPHAGSLSDAGGLALAAEALVKGAKDGVPPGAA